MLVTYKKEIQVYDCNSRSFDRILLDAEEKAIRFLEALDEYPADAKLNLDHIQVDIMSSHIEDRTREYSFTLTYSIYEKEGALDE